MEVPDDFNFSDRAVDSPEYKRRRKYPELQKPTDGHEKHLALLPPTVPLKISHGFKKNLPALEETPHSLSRMTELTTQTSGADEKPSDPSELKYRKRQREIYEKQDMGAEEIVQQYKLSVKKKYESVLSFLCGEQESFSALYTAPVIVQKNANGSFKNICLSELFQLYGLITIILQGDSGSGKTIIAQKIMLDWASDAVSVRRFKLVFYLKCEELMCISEEMNLIQLLSYTCSLTSEEISQILQQSPEKVLFIIDGFDELRLTQDIYDMSAHTNPLQKAPPEVILFALLRGRILPKSFLLVTTKTKDTVNKLLKGQPCFTEIMGFYEKEVEKYFQKFIFIKAYYSVIANETLFTACSIPIICRIISDRVKLGAVTNKVKTTTSIYADFVSTLLEHHCQGLSQSVPTLLRSLGQLAERGMLEQQVLFDEKGLHEISDPAYSPFLSRLLFKRRIWQETMFSFMHYSFQEFFTALFYVLLDEEESQEKVKELLHTVERGCVFSSWTYGDFSTADVEVRHAKLLQPVILFLCGLCKKKWIPSFFEKLNMAVSISVETQLKEWINQCSQRYQNEHMLFILHCLYELHEKSFVGKVLDGLFLIDLSNTPLKMADCWVLKYCLKCCEHIRNLKLHVTSDNLKMLQPELSRCKELWLMMDHISDDVVCLITAAGEGKILHKLIIKLLENSGGVFCPETVSVKNKDITLSVCSSVVTETSLKTEFTLTCPNTLISIIKWVKTQNERAMYSYSYFGLEEEEIRLLMFLKSLSGLKKVCLQVSNLTNKLAKNILYLIQDCPSLTEFSLNIRKSILVQIQSLMEKLKQMGWTLTVWRTSLFIQPDVERFTKVEVKTKREMKESKGESSDSVSYSSLKVESPTEQSFSENAEVFTPELIQRGDEDKHKNTYRFLCAHAGQFQCSLTNLVFVMEGEGKILYNIVSWDPRLLDGLGQMKPAGPLYNIDCAAGSVSQLHLPHCEIFTEKNTDGLAVAHFTGGNIEMIQPFNVTKSHVIIDIKDLSIFGLIKKIFSGSPIVAQVLLFLRPVTVEQEQKILNVHLLPGNVPVSEVQCYHQDKTYIETSSQCHLFPGRQYSLCCQPEKCEVQPMSEIFECNNFGQNHHPTFEVFLDVNIKEVRLGVLDKSVDGTEVWNRRRILLTAPSQGLEPPAQRRITETEFVNKHRDKLIERVSSVMTIADGLRTKDMIPGEMYSKVHAAEPRQEKMRLLLDILESGGAAVKAEFYRLLKKNEPHLVDELESGPADYSNAEKFQSD
ncbi:NACHT, LRR and PYD domains-containing protein 1 homolog isoform X2 [Onychostoma macrolepis]|uniref:NACHT, LRR and PYD domains-containing protein 1 homolog isoform X2 n=1 Tax=Onychostoma macrolepis TaxID=369639 RepID=UPI00272CFB69|nr:NACHT, LRR and PYD domains-containing protein 1 homolog isoform X2 [Onychostoma macrolepis]